MFGVIFVTERENNRVFVYDKGGVFMHWFGSKGSANGKFSAPCGIVVRPDGSAYISNHDSNRIQVISNYF